MQAYIGENLISRNQNYIYLAPGLAAPVSAPISWTRGEMPPTEGDPGRGGLKILKYNKLLTPLYQVLFLKYEAFPQQIGIFSFISKPAPVRPYHCRMAAQRLQALASSNSGIYAPANIRSPKYHRRPIMITAI